MRHLFIAASLLLASICYSQTRPLDIGDTLPPLIIEKLFNQPGKFDLRSHHGKLIILDFWTLNCLSCLTSMPKIDSLQDAFRDQLQFLLITPNSKEKVQQYFTRTKMKVPRVPMVTDDVDLDSLFPHHFVPHHVWIDEAGIVRYITGGNNANAETLQAYFSGKALSFTRYRDISDFDATAALWQEGDGRLQQHIRYYTSLTKFLPEYPYYYFQIKRQGPLINGVKILNASLLSLYQKAYAGLLETGSVAADHRLLIAVKDSAAFFPPADPKLLDRWQQEHYYSYEAESMPVSETEFCKKLQDDLASYFPYEVVTAKRQRDVLRVVPNEYALSASGKKGLTTIDTVNSQIHFDHVPLSTVYKYIQFYARQDGLLLDDSNADCFVGSLSLTYPFASWAIIQQELQRQAISCTVTNEAVDVLVIKDKPGTLVSRVPGLRLVPSAR